MRHMMNKDKMLKWMEDNHLDLAEEFVELPNIVDMWEEWKFEQWEGYNNQEPPDREDR